MARPKPARLSNEGLQRLERKLAVYANGYPPSSRTAALAILTGNGPAAAATDAYAGATYHATLSLIKSGEAAPPRLPPVAAARVEQHRPRFHIERTTPPRRRTRVMRGVLMAAGMVAIMVAAGVEVMLHSRANEQLVVVVPREIPAENDSGSSMAGAESDLPANPPVPLVTAADSDTPRVAPSPSAPVPATQMRVLLDEHFASNADGWANDPKGTAWLANGTYWLAPRQASHFVAVGIPGARDLGDTVISASFHKVGGPQGGGYGLILRDEGPDPLDGQNQLGHYYVFEVGDQGQFGVWLRDGDHWVDLLTWTSSDSVNRGTSANELTVTAIGDQLSFLINGTPVATQTDTVLHEGAAGVFVGGDGNQVALDRLTVRVPR